MPTRMKKKQKLKQNNNNEKKVTLDAPKNQALGALDIRNPELSESINIIPTNQRYLLEKKKHETKRKSILQANQSKPLCYFTILNLKRWGLSNFAFQFF